MGLRASVNRLRGSEATKTIPAQGKVRIPEALDRLIKLLTATKKPDVVKKWQTERVKYPPPMASMPREKM